MGDMLRAMEFIGVGAAWMYVGRSNYPERRLLEHWRDRKLNRLAVLHWTANRHEIEEVEEALIARAKSRFPLKCENTDDESSGPRSGPWHASYIAWKESAKARAIPVRWRTIHHLDEPPLAPTSGFLPFPIFLETSVPPERVDAIIADRYDGKVLRGRKTPSV